jgi:hypothetical protein
MVTKLSRYQANCLIMVKLQRVLDANPDWRFHQALQNCGVSLHGPADMFYEESEDTLARFNEITIEKDKETDNG